MYKPGTLLLSFLLYCSIASAQEIKGDIRDAKDKKAIAEVLVHNIYSNAKILCDEEGKFSIVVAKGELLEFTRNGYKTLRWRVPEGGLPPYFKVFLERSPEVMLPDYAHKAFSNYHDDSLYFANFYKNELAFPQLTGLDVIRHPFSAMSQRSQEIWAFQKEFTYFQQEKYIDYAFNPTLVAKITGLQGDSLQLFIKKYRPGYEQLRNMNEYMFYSYVKQTGEIFRYGRRGKSSIRRGSN